MHRLLDQEQDWGLRLSYRYGKGVRSCKLRILGLGLDANGFREEMEVLVTGLYHDRLVFFVDKWDVHGLGKGTKGLEARGPDLTFPF